MGMSLSPELLEDAIRKGLVTREQVYGERAAPVENGRHAQSAQNTGESAITLPKQAKRAPCSIGPCQSLWIPNWFPTPTNKLGASPRHWSGPAKLKKGDRDIVGFYARHITEATGPRRVSITLVLPKGKRLPDEDSLEKSTWDALVQCKRLVNDTPQWCRRGEINYVRALLGARPGTLILIEDL